MRGCRWVVYFLALWLGAWQPVWPQEVLKVFRLHGKGMRKYAVRCKVINNLVIIPVSVNGSDTLQLILDTGINSIIITELGARQEVNLKYAREVELKGLGAQGGVMAYHSIGNEVKIGKLSGGSQDIFVLEPGRIDLSAKMGITVNGLIGYPLFRDFAVQVDYSSALVRFIPHNLFEVPRKYTRLPLQINESKAMVAARVNIFGSQVLQVRLLLDSGASSPVWFDTHNQSGLSVPDQHFSDVLGEGLNGEVTGKMARIASLSIGPYEFNGVVAAFPDSGSLVNASGLPDRQGSIGSDLLRRFDYIVNYYDSSLYLRPNSSFKQPFRYNVSGVDIVKPYRELPVYVIHRIRKGSPAAMSGLMPEDQLVRVDGRLVKELDMEEINHLVHYGKHGKVTLEIMRNGRRQIFRIKLDSEI